MLYKEFSNTAVFRGALSGVTVMLFDLHNGRTVRSGTATGSETGATSEAEAARGMHNHDLPSEKSKELVVIRIVVIAQSSKDLDLSLQGPHE